MTLIFNICPVNPGKSVQSLVILFIILSSQYGETSVVGNVDSNSQVQGLYSSEDKIVIFSKGNFNTKLFNKSHAWLIEFYNSWCGFCRKFAPHWKEFAADVMNWKSVVTIGAIDCANDENNDICRNYEIMAYPTLKYFHKNYVESDKFGETIPKGNSPVELRQILVDVLQKEQMKGKEGDWPRLLPQNFTNLNEVWDKIPTNIKYNFLIFDTENSTMGAEVILDLNTVYGIAVTKVSNSSQLVKQLQIQIFPSVFVIDKNFKSSMLYIGDKSRISVRKSIINYLHSKNVNVPINIDNDNKDAVVASATQTSLFNTKTIEAGDIVYQTDLETGLRYTLNNEVSRLKYIRDDALEALKNYLNVLIKFFPFTANGKEFVTQLRKQILYAKELSGKEFAEHVDELENKYAPVYSTLPEWYGCKGSAPNYRGFTCSLWTIFHVLTVSAAAQKTNDASEVLRAMHGYVKHFFGCTDCSEHFQAMAKKNNLFSVAESDGGIIWLWVAHNEVNHRLAGDITEDPEHPKRQFPVIENCPKCWLDKGAWNMTEVLHYLKNIYGVGQISLSGVVPHPSSSPLSKFDITIFILLHVYFAIMLLLVLRMILIKKIYKRKSYKNDALRKV